MEATRALLPLSVYVVGEHKGRPNQWSLASEYRIWGLIEGFRV